MTTTEIETNVDAAPIKNVKRGRLVIAAERTVTADAIDVSLFADATKAKPVWVQLAVQGNFKGHGSGEFTLDDIIFGQILLNWQRDAKRAIPLDWEHQSEREANGPTPACGWIVDLKIDAGSLWGLVAWGDEARALILSGAYKYLSPAIRFGAKDRVTGKPIGAVLSSAGITNRPFLRMAPLAAKDTPPEGEGSPPDALLLSETLDANAVLSKKNKKLKKRLGEAELELVTLREEVARVTQTEITNLVTSAILTKNLGEESRQALTAMCLRDREAFTTAFGAPVNQRDAHLLRDLTTTGNNRDLPSIGGPESTPKQIDMSSLPTIKEVVDKLVAKGVGFEEAHVLAYEKVQKATKKLVEKSRSTF